MENYSVITKNINNSTMTNKNSILGKVIALAILPALALGMFAAPAMAFAFGSFGGVMTVIDVANVNTAGVVNAISVKSDTGDNTANGGDGAEGGDSGDSGDNAGEGGEGGDGGEADANGGDEAYAESGFGGDGGYGGNTGNTGNTGAGGDGGLGGQIATGDAFASVAIGNDINSNDTMITIDDNCECDRYNEYYEAADKYFERNRESWSLETSEGDNNDWFRNWNNDDESQYSEESSSDSLVKDSHWEVYTKTYVPVTTIVGVDNINSGFVVNTGDVEAETGGNTANGGDGDEAGDSGDSGDDAGVGGEAGDGGEAEADASSNDHFAWWNNNDDAEATAIAYDGGDGGDGGDTGTTGNTGAGGDGAEGGLIVTGQADSLAAVVNVMNRNVTRIVR